MTEMREVKQARYRSRAVEMNDGRQNDPAWLACGRPKCLALRLRRVVEDELLGEGLYMSDNLEAPPQSSLTTDTMSMSLCQCTY